jgi:hypothetical protein
VTIPQLPPLSPRSATEIVDGSVQLIRPEFTYFMKIAAVGAIPALVQALVTMVFFKSTSTDPSELMRQQLSLLPLTLLTFCFALVQSGAIVGSALSALKGEPLPSVWTAYTAAFRRIFSLIGATLLLSLVLLLVIVPLILVFALVSVGAGGAFSGLLSSGSVGTVLVAVLVLISLAIMAVFGLTYLARSSVMSVLVIAEKLGPVDALRRAHALARGSNFHLLKVFGLAALIIGVVYAVMFALIALLPNPNTGTALASVLMIPVAPIFGAIMLLSYADLRVRREGADLDAALDSLAVPTAPAHALR